MGRFNPLVLASGFAGCLSICDELARRRFVAAFFNQRLPGVPEEKAGGDVMYL